jgi:hypothetical protein
LYDAFPLLGYTREFSFGPPKPDETPGPKKPKSPIDTLVDIGMGVRCATCDSADSRVIVLNDGRIRSHRLVVPRRNHDMPFSKLASGWALTEHADRLEWMLHLFDPSSPPRLGVNINAYSLIVEPFWERTPTKPGDALGYSVGIACGEAAGASAEGVWIAARRPTATGIAVGIVARLSVACSRRDVALVVGQQTFETELIATTTEFGPLQFATIDLRDIAPDTPVALTVAGIAARRGK